MTWYALEIDRQKEISTYQVLSRKGYTCYLPVQTKERRRAKGGRVEIIIPVFPRYIFVQHPFSWLHLRAERHVRGVVSVTNDGNPSPIDDAQIEVYRSGVSRQLARIKASAPRALKAGDLATIAGGEFKGQTVKIEGLHGRNAKIFVNLFNRQTLTDIAIEKLEAA